MKRNYISPEITLIKLHTETVMAATSLSSVSVKDYKGEVIQNSDINISKDIEIWDGSSQPETAKDNGGNDLWDNEN